MSDIPKQFIITSDKQRYPVKSYRGKPKGQLIEQVTSLIIAGHDEPEIISNVNRLVADMIISGYYNDLWSIIFKIWVKYIHLKNMEMSSWLLKKYYRFSVLRKKHCAKELHNIQEIRNMFSQIVTTLLISPKLKIEIKSRPHNHPLQDNSMIVAKHYGTNFGIQDNTEFLTCLAQFIEFYNRNALKGAFHWLKAIANSKITIKPYTGFRISKKIATAPLWVIWSLMYQIGDKKNADTIILNDLRQIFMYFLSRDDLDYALLYTYIMVSYVRHCQKLRNTMKIINSSTVIKETMFVNFRYVQD